MTGADPACSTVVAWYDALPEALARLTARLQAAAVDELGDAFAPRHCEQVHATLVGLERVTGPFDPGPLAAHLRAVLARPVTVQFGGFGPTDRRMLSRRRTLHERGFAAHCGRVVLMGWPVVDGIPRDDVAVIRDGCGALGVTHRYGSDPDVYLVIGDVAPGTRVDRLEAAVRDDLARAPVQVPLSADDLCLVTYADTTLPRPSTSWRPLREL